MEKPKVEVSPYLKKGDIYMIKLMIVTHGPLADALKESSAMFFGSMSNDVETIGLYPTENPEELKEKICEKVESLDDGDGVMIFVDIFAGSPFNMTALAIDELKGAHKLQCFTGVNMPFLMEALSSCQSMKMEELTKHLTSIAKDTIVDLRLALDI